MFSLFSNEPVTRHYHIKKNSDGKLYLSEKHAFDTIPELINYHKHNSGGNFSSHNLTHCVISEAMGLCLSF